MTINASADATTADREASKVSLVNQGVMPSPTTSVVGLNEESSNTTDLYDGMTVVTTA